MAQAVRVVLVEDSRILTERLTEAIEQIADVHKNAAFALGVTHFLHKARLRSTSGSVERDLRSSSFEALSECVESLRFELPLILPAATQSSFSLRRSSRWIIQLFEFPLRVRCVVRSISWDWS